MEQKESKVPERVYIAATTFPDYINWEGSPINSTRVDKNDIEYIRIDSILEKFREWISMSWFDYITVKHGTVDTYVDFDSQKMMEDFCKETIL